MLNVVVLNGGCGAASIIPLTIEVALARVGLAHFFEPVTSPRTWLGESPAHKAS